MKKLIVIIALLITGCNGSTDTNKCLESVRRVYPNAKIYKNPNLSFTFYVVDSAGMKKVTTLNWFNADIDGITEYGEVKTQSK